MSGLFYLKIYFLNVPTYPSTVKRKFVLFLFFLLTNATRTQVSHKIPTKEFAPDKTQWFWVFWRGVYTFFYFFAAQMYLRINNIILEIDPKF